MRSEPKGFSDFRIRQKIRKKAPPSATLGSGHGTGAHWHYAGRIVIRVRGVTIDERVGEVSTRALVDFISRLGLGTALARPIPPWVVRFLYFFLRTTRGKNFQE